MQMFRFEINIHTANQRLDKFLASELADFSRNRLQQLIENGHVHISSSLNSAKTALSKPTPSLKLKDGDIIEMEIPPLEEAIPVPMDIPLDIIYEDDDLLVINKAPGMVVHPAPGHSEDTLVNALLAHCGDSLSGIGGVKRPGIVHRLDKDTSGLMVVAKHDIAHQRLSSQFSDRSLSRLYVAIVWGLPSPSTGTIETHIGRHPQNRQKMAVVTRNGREAITNYHVTHHYGNSGDIALNLSLIECKLLTGRTHQIRVHLHHIGHPLLGDPLYGHAPKKAIKVWPQEILSFPRQALHAKYLQFYHPSTQEKMEFSAPLPKDLMNLITIMEDFSSQ